MIRNSAARLPIRDWESAAPDPAIEVVRALQSSARLVAHLQRALAEARLPPFDLARLLWLWSEHDKPMRVGDIASGLGLSRSAACRLVARGDQAGLVEHRRGVLDRREMSVRLTTRGRAATYRMDAVVRASAREPRTGSTEPARHDDTSAPRGGGETGGGRS